jgi:hypothetical protein
MVHSLAVLMERNQIVTMLTSLPTSTLILFVAEFANPTTTPYGRSFPPVVLQQFVPVQEHRKGSEILFANVNRSIFSHFSSVPISNRANFAQGIAENEEIVTFIMAGPVWVLIALRARRTQSQRASSLLRCSTPHK